MTELVRSDWDELMLAMDVVDTLRHRKAELDRIIGEESDDQALVEKIRRIYDSQGIAVSEHTIRDAVAALKEERFSYRRPADGWRRNLGNLWVDRTKWSRRIVIAVVLAATLGGGAWKLNEIRDRREEARQSHLVSQAIGDFAEERQMLTNRSAGIKAALQEDFAFGRALQGAGQSTLAEVREALARADTQLMAVSGYRPEEHFTFDKIDNGGRYRWPESAGLPLVAAGRAVDQAETALQRATALAGYAAEYEALIKRGQEIAVDEEARQAVSQAASNIPGALTTGNADARDALDRLNLLVEGIASSFQLRIVSRPGVRSGVWRYPDGNSSARNYYIIVEAVDAAGQKVRLPVTSEETGQTHVVSMWGVRVDERTYESVRADKLDDGIIQKSVIGRKRSGHLDPEYRIETTGGAITRW